METEHAAANGSQNEKAIIEDGRLIVELACAHCPATFSVNADDPKAAVTGCCPDCVAAGRHWTVLLRQALGIGQENAMSTATTITDECPAGGTHTPGWAEDDWGRLHRVCDECGAPAPRFDEPRYDRPRPLPLPMGLSDMADAEDDPF